MEDCEEVWELGFEMVCVGNECVNINFDGLVLFLTNKYFPYHLFTCHWQENSTWLVYHPLRMVLTKNWR